MKKVLITGITGFVGSHLTELLLAKNFKITGLAHPKHPISNLNKTKGKIQIVLCDLLDKKLLDKSLKKITPDYIFHLAAVSSAAKSFKDPISSLENNIIGQVNILEVLAKSKSNARILIVGSSDEYGQINDKDLPVTEETELAPASPYAVSKVAQDLLGFQYHQSYNLNTVRVRAFNHIGPRQSKDFAIPSFAKQIAKLEKKGGGILKVGNLNAYRDFTDVRDIAKAYLLALEKCDEGDVYNIGSGKAIQIKKILDILLSFSKVKIQVEKDKKLFRPADINKIYCDFSKFYKKTGWKPQIPLSRTLFDTIEYERQLLGNNT